MSIELVTVHHGYSATLGRERRHVAIILRHGSGTQHFDLRGTHALAARQSRVLQQVYRPRLTQQFIVGALEAMRRCSFVWLRFLPMDAPAATAANQLEHVPVAQIEHVICNTTVDVVLIVWICCRHELVRVPH